MLNMRVLGVAHLSSQLRSTQPTSLRIRFQFLTCTPTGKKIASTARSYRQKNREHSSLLQAKKSRAQLAPTGGKIRIYKVNRYN